MSDFAGNIAGKAEESALSGADAETVWKEDLSERVQEFRRRRARLRGGFDPNTSLDFEFDSPETDDAKASVGAQVVEFTRRTEPSGQETPVSDSDLPVLEPLAFEGPSDSSGLADGLDILSSAVQTTKSESEPVEIVLESPVPSESSADELHPVLPLAPLGRRFLAGLADLLVLLLAAGLFGVIFWFAGGHLTLEPLNLVVAAFLAVFFVAAYFGAFTALAGATAGQLLFGLEVRNWEGQFPTARESAWRAFGYLISAAALMLGFVWMFVDSDALGWHDHISGTFVTSRRAE